MRRHRIAFYGTLPIKLDPGLTLSFEDQVRGGETRTNYVGKSVLTMFTYDLYMKIKRKQQLPDFSMADIAREYPDKKSSNNWYRQAQKYKLSTNGDFLVKTCLRTRTVNGQKTQESINLRTLHLGNVFDEMVVVHYVLAPHQSLDALHNQYFMQGFNISFDFVKKFRETCEICCAQSVQAPTVKFDGAVRPIISHQFLINFGSACKSTWSA
jgi:hypothetical protein